MTVEILSATFEFTSQPVFSSYLYFNKPHWVKDRYWLFNFYTYFFLIVLFKYCEKWIAQVCDVSYQDKTGIFNKNYSKHYIDHKAQ